jgi:hypothetical protein
MVGTHVFDLPNVLLHVAMFFSMSFFKDDRVTQSIVQPALSKLDDAVVMAVQVLPEPVLCHNNMP